MTTESWRDAIGFEGFYSISSIGRVRRETKRTNGYSGKILKPWITNGYEMFGLWRNGKQTKISGHRLVACAFIDRLADCTEVNHKNGIKSDNHVENLEWVSHKGNAQHAKQSGFLKEKLSESERAEIKSLRTQRPLMGLNAIGRKFGIHRSTVMALWREP